MKRRPVQRTRRAAFPNLRPLVEALEDRSSPTDLLGSFANVLGAGIIVGLGQDVTANPTDTSSSVYVLAAETSAVVSLPQEETPAPPAEAPRPEPAPVVAHNTPAPSLVPFDNLFPNQLGDPLGQAPSAGGGGGGGGGATPSDIRPPAGGGESGNGPAGGGTNGGAAGGGGEMFHGPSAPTGDAAPMTQSATTAAIAPTETPNAPPPALAKYGAQPMRFEANVGQADSQVAFLSRGKGYNLFLTPAGAAFTLAQPSQETNSAPTFDVLAMRFGDANPEAKIVGEGLLEGRSNYFSGDPSTWLANVPNYSSVKIENVYAGIDARFYGNDQGLLEYDFVVHPGAEASQIRLEYDGVSSVSVDPSGVTHLATASGEVRSWSPVSYQVNADGLRTEQTPVASYVSLGDNQIGFQVSGYDSTQELVIDPSIDYSTYLGGSGNDDARGIAVDGDGSTFITGKTASSNFPTLHPIYSSLSGSSDAYVTKLSADGSSIVYSTYLGGSSDDWVNAIAVDLSGNAYVTGYTNSSNFPTTLGAKQTTGSNTIFLAKLNQTGDSLGYSTYFGTAAAGMSMSRNEGLGVAVDATGQAYITGRADGTISTTTGAYQTSKSNSFGFTDNAFIAEFKADGSDTVYASYIGKGGNSEGHGIAIDSNGYAYICGRADNDRTNFFPTTSGAYAAQSATTGTVDSFVAKFNTTGTGLVYSTILGGTPTDQADAIAINSAGNAYVVGQVLSGTGFPTTGGFQTTFGGSTDAYITEFNTGGTGIVYSSYLGGTNDDYARGVAVDSAGRAYVTGKTNSTNFPTASAWQSSIAGGAMMYSGADAFVTEVASNGASVVYSSYLGGTNNDEGNAIALDLVGNAYVAGVTSSTDFPTRSPYQSSLSSATDAFAAKVGPETPPPVITAISSDTGSSSTDLITNDQTLTISGTSLSGATIDVYLPGDTSPIGTVTASGGGTWSFNYTGTTLAEGTYGFWATATANSLVSKPSTTALVKVDLTAPTITLSAPSSTASYAPQIKVWGSDLVGLPSSPTVTIDADLNNDNDFLDAGESGYTTGTLVNGYCLITLPTFSSAGTYHLRARVTDLAGNQGTSATSSMDITSLTSWSMSANALLNRPNGGQPREALGAVTLAHALDLDLSPGSGQAGNPALVYDGTSLNIKPVIQGVVSTVNNAALPSTIGVELIWDGTSLGTTNYSTTGLVKGDQFTVAARPSSAVSTGRHTWELRVKVTGQPDLVASGSTFAVDQSSSAFGAGWNLSILNKLIDIPASGALPAGKLWLYGTGGWRFFEGTSGTFTSPADDNGTLVKNGGGDFTYTAADKSKIDFDSSGYQTDWVSADGKETISFTYTSGLLTGLTAIDGSTTTFNYTSSKLSSISAPGSRTFTTSVNGTTGDLDSITNPDTGVHSFTYSSHRVTGETFGSHIENHWAYDSNGFLNQYKWGTTSTPSVYTIVSAASIGVGAFSKGAPMASVTDPLGGVTTYAFDEAGRLTKAVSANGATTTYTLDTAGQVTQIVDPMGRTTSYTRDTKEYVTRETLPDSSHRDWTYDTTYGFHTVLTYTDERTKTVTTNTIDTANGHILTTTDALSNTTTFTFNSTTGLLSTITDPLSRVTTITWDSHRRKDTEETKYSTTTLSSVSYTYSTTNGEVATTTDAGSVVTTLGHDAMGRLTSTQVGSVIMSGTTYDGAGLVVSASQSGVSTAYTFDSYNRGIATQTSVGGGLQVTLSTLDSAGRTTQTRDGRGFWTNFLLDSVGNTLQTTDATGAITRALYNLDNEVTDSWDAQGGHTANSINSRGWVYSVLDGAGKTSGSTFDNAGNVLTSTDGRGKVTTNTYNDNGQIATSTDPSTNQWQMSYWGDGSVQNQTDARGIITRTAFDLANRKTTVTAAYGLSSAVTTATIVDNTGFTIEQDDGLGHKVTYVPDSYERLYQVKNNAGTVLEQDTYDDAGNTLTSKDGLLKETDFLYNKLNQQIKATDPNSNATQSVVDAEGEVTATIDGAGKVSQQVFDPRGELVTSRDANGGLTKRTYDSAGNLLSLTDPVGNTTRWAYDKNNNKIKETDALGNSRSWTYNDDNQVATYTDKNGRYKEYAYYDNGQLHTETWKTAPGGTTVNTIAWVYNANGQPTSVADNAGTISWAYDDLGRLYTFTDVWGKTLTYTLDAANRLTNISDSFSGSTTITWDNNNRVTQRSFSDGTAQLAIGYQFNNRDDITEVDRYSDSAATTLVGKTLYTRDDGGRVTAISHKNASNVVIDSFSYTFDHADRVTQETSTLGTTQNYGYDPTGQLTSDSSGSYSFDLNGNRTMTGYSTGTDNRLSSDGTWNYTFDSEGNTTQKTNISTGEVWLFSYDHNNRMTKAEHKASSGGAVDLRIVFAYDALGNRVERDYDADGDGSGSPTVEKYSNDPQGNVWADLNSSGSLTTRRLSTDAVDAVFARIGASGNEDWYLTDHLGSIRDIANSSGTLVDHRDYASFGAISSESSPSNGDRFGYTSKQREADLGMQFNDTRYYQFDIGRWTTKDTIGFRGGPNPYEYVGNGPTNAIDPQGTLIWTLPLAAAGPVGWAVAFVAASVALAYTAYKTTQAIDHIIRDDLLGRNPPPQPLRPHTGDFAHVDPRAPSMTGQPYPGAAPPFARPHTGALPGDSAAPPASGTTTPFPGPSGLDVAGDTFIERARIQNEVMRRIRLAQLAGTTVTFTAAEEALLRRLGILCASLDPNKPAQDILPGSLKREFPSEYLGKSLNEIKEMLKTATGPARRALQKAKKLLEQIPRLMGD